MLFQLTSFVAPPELSAKYPWLVASDNHILALSEPSPWFYTSQTVHFVPELPYQVIKGTLSLSH